MKVVIVYWSKTWNTEKETLAVKQGAMAARADVLFKTTDEATGLGFFEHDLVCIGSPSYEWRPPKPAVAPLTNRFSGYHHQGRVIVGAPKVAEENTLVFRP